jgi:hypothetical protein
MGREGSQACPASTHLASFLGSHVEVSQSCGVASWNGEKISFTGSKTCESLKVPGCWGIPRGWTPGKLRGPQWGAVRVSCVHHTDTWHPVWRGPSASLLPCLCHPILHGECLIPHSEDSMGQLQRVSTFQGN